MVIEAFLYLARNHERRSWILVYANTIAVDFPDLSSAFGNHRIPVRAV